MSDITRCYGHDCPLRDDCYRYTMPRPGRDALARVPYDEETGSCQYFYSNEPSEEGIRLTAYHIWLREGKPEGEAEAHWERAYEELCRSMGRAV
ncbi:MAG TPA: DUF2934 domain-containing protein [Anaerolineae bacterium]|nr:DUF2934 domain-containing protein [Anaerolineae bacterium]